MCCSPEVSFGESRPWKKGPVDQGQGFATPCTSQKLKFHESTMKENRKTSEKMIVEVEQA
jgi:hypothetical protein